jgi:hypothetical protein
VRKVDPVAIISMGKDAMMKPLECISKVMHLLEDSLNGQFLVFAYAWEFFIEIVHLVAISVLPLTQEKMEIIEASPWEENKMPVSMVQDGEVSAYVTMCCATCLQDLQVIKLSFDSRICKSIGSVEFFARNNLDLNPVSNRENPVENLKTHSTIDEAI